MFSLAIVLRHNIIICWLLMTIVFLPINIPFESPLRVYIFGVVCWKSNYSSQINQHHPWQTYLCSSPNTSPNIAQLGMGKRTLHGMFIPTCPMLRAFYRTSKSLSRWASASCNMCDPNLSRTQARICAPRIKRLRWWIFLGVPFE